MRWNCSIGRTTPQKLGQLLNLDSLVMVESQNLLRVKWVWEYIHTWKCASKVAQNLLVHNLLKSVLKAVEKYKKKTINVYMYACSKVVAGGSAWYYNVIGAYVCSGCLILWFTYFTIYFYPSHRFSIHIATIHHQFSLLYSIMSFRKTMEHPKQAKRPWFTESTSDSRYHRQRIVSILPWSETPFK